MGINKMQARLNAADFIAVWLVYEQVAIAALDTRAMELAISLIQKIRKKFPTSSRTYRLTVRNVRLQT